MNGKKTSFALSYLKKTHCLFECFNSIKKFLCATKQIKVKGQKRAQQNNLDQQSFLWKILPNSGQNKQKQKKRKQSDKITT